MTLTIFYTGNLRGQIEILPHLHTFIRELGRGRIDDDDEVMLCAVQPPTPGQTLLLDLGDSCAADAWHCAATGGRSVLLGLDAMGYHAANVEGLLTAEARARLADNFLSVALVDAAQSWQSEDVVVSYKGGFETRPYSLHISFEPALKTTLEKRRLRLASVSGPQVGMARVSGLPAAPTLAAAAVFDLPANTPPDPTIAGAVDFVLSEARLFARRNT